MRKILAIAISLGLATSAAVAQTPTYAPGGATGAAPTRDVGTNTPNSSQTGNGSTESTSMLEQRVKQQSARGASGSSYNTFTPDNAYQAQDRTSGTMYHGKQVRITDEYGFKYDEYGERIR